MIKAKCSFIASFNRQYNTDNFELPWLSMVTIFRLASSKLTSDTSLIKPIEDKVVGLFTLELGGHVSCTMHCCESQVAIVGLEVACNLLIDNVWSP